VRDERSQHGAPRDAEADDEVIGQSSPPSPM
jgi:hypothetical protein